MIKTVWFAVGCLVVLLCAMAAGKVAKAPATEATDEKPVAGATVGIDLAQEPLIKADRLEVAYVRQENPSQSTLHPIDQVVPEVQKMISPAETNIVSRHWHDPNAIKPSISKYKRTTKSSKSAADRGCALSIVASTRPALPTLSTVALLSDHRTSWPNPAICA